VSSHAGLGLPWDLEQNLRDHRALYPEEAYEVVMRIMRGDLVDLRDELGDLLLQASITRSWGEGARRPSTSAMWSKAITDKMIRRHPHVFGDEATRSAVVAKGFWEEAKPRKGRQEGLGDGGAGAAAQEDTVLANVPLALPALFAPSSCRTKRPVSGSTGRGSPRSSTSSRKSWMNSTKPSLGTGRRGLKRSSAICCSWWPMSARHLQIDRKQPCVLQTNKFVRRFRYIERALAARGTHPADSDLQEWMRYGTRRAC